MIANICIDTLYTIHGVRYIGRYTRGGKVHRTQPYMTRVFARIGAIALMRKVHREETEQMVRAIDAIARGLGGERAESRA